ncbi:CASP C terminal-domain-containing protein [Crepidotus variabilis]|uniref:Protein CASP n=1 Tax=Crepidotus variabilis TaxID=179855 RepID=A0A9P6EHZ3_9AGAR|nr:CASP C terminal-domain-containing protein [Crepidotus variabilis]
MASETNFSAALSTWKDINLSELQKTLDTQGIELVDNQKESVVGRKALAEKTKDFKKLPEDEKVNAFKGLLKAYQTEIDNLTKRSKASDNAFLHVYKLIAEAPDPYPLLEAAVDQAVKVAEAMEQETELQKLREENTELKKKLSETSSLEVAKKKLETKVDQLEQKMDGMIQDKVSQKANELTATYDEKLRNYEEREQDLQRQLSLTKNQLRDLRTANESNQAKLFDHSQKQDQETAAKLAEVDMIIADLDRANSRVVTLEHRNEILRANIETMKGGAESSERVKGLESQVSELEKEVESLSHSLESQQGRTAEVQHVGQKKLEELQKEIQKRSLEVDQLRLKLKQLSDYDEIKRELDIMKFVEFSGFDANEEGEDGEVPKGLLTLPSPNAQKALGREGSSLETLLASKNKRLQEELTKLRILHSELEEHLRTSQERLDQATVDLQKQKELNDRLEVDLLSINKPTNEPATNDKEVDVLASLDSIGRKTDSPTRSTPIPFVPSADTSILPIVTSQRDRFRQRNAELEEELRKQFQIISELRAEIKTLQSDNLKLYEKVRYMQSYREEAGSRPVTQLDPLPPPSGLPDGMSKYQARYEEAMNPFEAFRGREATRAYQALNPVERGVLALTRSILGNRRARGLFICYAFALHVMVLYTTYGCAGSSTHLEAQPNPYHK